MDRRTWMLHLAAAGAATGLTQVIPLSASSAEQSDADCQIARAASAALAMQRRDWEQGTLAQAFLELGDYEQVIRLTRAATVLKQPDGRIGVVGSGSPTDPAMGGEAYIRAAELTGDPAMKDAAEGLLDWILRRAPRAPDGTLYHVFGSPQVWSDGFNGAPPFLAATGHYEEAIHQIDGFYKRLWDPDKKLLVHIVNDGAGVEARKEYWGGGNGWAATGLARIIRSLPESYGNERKRLAGLLSELLDGCLVHQRPDGLFHDMIDRPGTFVETNLAQMLAFAIYTSVLGGWLSEKYLLAAGRMRMAARKKMDKFGYVQDVCGSPTFDRPGVSTEGQAFHMLMEGAAQKLERRKQS